MPLPFLLSFYTTQSMPAVSQRGHRGLMCFDWLGGRELPLFMHPKWTATQEVLKVGGMTADRGFQKMSS